MDMLHKITYSGDSLRGDFNVQRADVKLPALRSVELTVETFIPAGPGKVRSSFMIAWHIEGGGFFTAMVRSEYRLTHNAELPYLQFRYISFEADCGPDKIQQTEHLDVFRSLDAVAR